MVRTDVHRSYDDAFVRASASLRERFAAHVMAADCWTEGVAAALADVGDGLVEEMEAAQVSLTELRAGGLVMRLAYDADLQARLASIAQAWHHHHPEAAVPELQLEFFIGAVSYAVAAALQRGDVEDLGTQLTGLTMLAPMVGA
jgi:hypothetical protein